MPYDPNRPKSDAALDQGWGYGYGNRQTSDETDEAPARPEPRPLTASQQRERTRRLQEAADRAKRQPIGPSYDALKSMTEADKQHALDQIRAIKAGHFMTEQAEVQSPEPQTLDQVDPDEIDPGRPF